MVEEAAVGLQSEPGEPGKPSVADGPERPNKAGEPEKEASAWDDDCRYAGRGDEGACGGEDACGAEGACGDEPGELGELGRGEPSPKPCAEDSAAYAIFDSQDNTLRFVRAYCNAGADADADAAGRANKALRQVSSLYDDACVTVYSGFEGATYNIASEVPWAMHRSCIRAVEFADYVAPRSTANWFAHFSSLTAFDAFGYLDMSQATSARDMFYGCESLTTVNMSGWDLGQLADAEGIFGACPSLVSMPGASAALQTLPADALGQPGMAVLSEMGRLLGDAPHEGTAAPGHSASQLGNGSEAAAADELAGSVPAQGTESFDGSASASVLAISDLLDDALVLDATLVTSAREQLRARLGRAAFASPKANAVSPSAANQANATDTLGYPAALASESTTASRDAASSNGPQGPLAVAVAAGREALSKISAAAIGIATAATQAVAQAAAQARSAAAGETAGESFATLAEPVSTSFSLAIAALAMLSTASLLLVFCLKLR